VKAIALLLACLSTGMLLHRTVWRRDWEQANRETVERDPGSRAWSCAVLAAVAALSLWGLL
jgi:hypothetical protein